MHPPRHDPVTVCNDRLLRAALLRGASGLRAVHHPVLPLRRAKAGVAVLMEAAVVEQGEVAGRVAVGAAGGSRRLRATNGCRLEASTRSTNRSTFAERAQTRTE